MNDKSIFYILFHSILWTIMTDLTHRKSILYHLHIVDETSENFDDLFEYPC